MTLKEYIEKNRIIRVYMAKELGISYAQLYRIIEGKSPPSASLAKRLWEYTEREVSLESILFNI